MSHFIQLPAGLGSQDHVDGVHPHAHDVDHGLACLRVGQAVDAQGLQSGSAAGRGRWDRESEKQ